MLESGDKEAFIKEFQPRLPNGSDLLGTRRCVKSTYFINKLIERFLIFFITATGFKPTTNHETEDAPASRL